AEIIQSRGGEGSNPQVDPVMEQTPVLVLLGAQPYIAPVLPQLSPSVERASKGTRFEKGLVTYREQAIDGVGNTHLDRVVQRLLHRFPLRSHKQQPGEHAGSRSTDNIKRLAALV